MFNLRYTRYTYKKVEKESVYNVRTVTHGIKEDRLDRKNDGKVKKSLLIYNYK